MALGTTDFKPSKGDLVKVISDKYPSMPKGTIARVICISTSGTKYIIEGYTDAVTDASDLEILSYNRARTSILT